MSNLFYFLKNTPLHPQWFSFRDESILYSLCNKHAKGLVIDIGCADKRIKSYLPENCNYYGLDYPETAIDLYETSPDVFGNAQNLPFSDNNADSVTMIEVLEHIPEANLAIAEASRILKINGKLILTVPFLYPIHDAPYDFHRFTKYAIEKLASANNFAIVEIIHRGSPSETAALLRNIAMVKSTMSMISKFNPIGLLLLLLLPIYVPLVNILGAFYALFDYKDDFMPFGYRVILRKITL